MTDEGRYIAQGKARDLAKKLRSEVATLHTWYEEYAQKLAEMQHGISHFLTDPNEPSHFCGGINFSGFFLLTFTSSRFTGFE